MNSSKLLAEQAVHSAALEYLNRKSRKSDPNGQFDSVGRWYPSKQEMCFCCAVLCPPSRKYPYSYMNHCRTAEHVANLLEVDRRDLLAAAKQVNALSQPKNEATSS